jgi:hypothetical protein
MKDWNADDARVIGDIVLGTLLAGGLRLVVVKAFIEPIAVMLGRIGYRRLDQAMGDRLPDFLRGDRP